MSSPTPRSRRARFRALVPALTLATAGVVACGDGPSGPKPTMLAPGVTIVSGTGFADTIESRTGPLVLRLRDDNGQARAGVPVRFEVPDSSHWSVGVCYTALLSHCRQTPPVGAAFGDTGTVTSDDEGLVSMPILIGRRATEAWVRVLVPSLGVRDSVKYVVRPGRAASVVFKYGDTSVYVGTRLRRPAVVVDRMGNTVAGAVELSGDSHVSVAADGELTATSIGMGIVKARGAGFTSQTFVSVNPHGVLAASDTAGIFITELDASAPRLVGATVQDLGMPAWSPDGRTIYGAVGVSGRMYAVDVATGNAQPVRDAAGGLVDGWSPSPSRDGRWLYFARVGGAGRLELATGRVESLPTPGLVHFGPRVVDVSPDGRWLAYEVTVNSQPRGRVLDLASGTATATDLPGWRPRWSPDGARLAFVNYAEALAVANADGSGARVVSGGDFWTFREHDVDWSADGEYLVSTAHNGFAIVRVSTGETMFTPNTSAHRRDVAIRR